MASSLKNLKETLSQDFRYALRHLRHAKAFALVVIATLALGIGASTAIFSLVNAWLLRPLPLPEPQQLIEIWRTQAKAPSDPAFFDSYRDYVVWAAQNRSFQSLAAMFEQSYALTGVGEPRKLHGAVATWNLLSAVGTTPQIGRLFQAADVHGEPECIISHALWVREFQSSPKVLDRSITLNDKLYRVVGVLPASFSLRVLDRPFETDVWTLIMAGDPTYSASSMAAVAVVGRLKQGVSSAQAQGDVSGIQRELDQRFPDEPANSGVLVVNLQKDNTRTVRSSLLLLFGAVAVLLLIACVNAGSLILGRNSQRVREFAVRVALGCGTRRLLQQLTTEVLVLFVAGGLAGLLIAWIFLRVFVAWNPMDVLPAGGISLDATVLLVTAVVVCITALLFGSLPALRALRAIDAEALRSGASAGRSIAHARSRTLFVGGEISLSVILLVAAGLLISTFIKIGSEPLGFETQHVFVTDVSLPYSVYPKVADQTRFGDELARRIREISSIRAAGVALSYPFNVNGLSPMEIQGQEQPKLELLPHGAAFTVGQGYFDALGVPLLRGSVLSDENRADSPAVAVINEEMARKYFPGTDPIGKRIRRRYIDEKPEEEPWLTIIGVVGNTRSLRYNHIDWDRYPAVYMSLAQRTEDKVHNSAALTLYIYFRTPYSVSVSTIANVVHSLNPNLPVGNIRSTGEIVSSLRSQPRLRATLLGGFAVLTLLLAAIGVYGVMMQMTEQRRRDIGIRIALGALASDIRAWILRRALALTILGLLVGVAGAAILTRLLRGFLYGISALDPTIFLGVVLLLCAVALLASYIPARRASKVDPMEMLRSE